MEYLERIRNFPFNIKLQKYKDYINYMHKLDLNELTEIIDIMIDYKKYNICNIKNGNLDKLYNAYLILLHKLEYDELNIKERDIYENIVAYLIIKGDYTNDKYFNLYCKKYLKNINIHNFNRRIFLIMQDVLNILNTYHGNDIKFKLEDTADFASVNWLDLDFKDNILLNTKKFTNYYYKNETEKINIINKTIYYIFVVCHEYEHILQKKYMYTNNNELSTMYKNDLYILGTFYNFYQMYHDNFYLEKEADNYGIMNALEYISKYFQDSILIKKDLKDYLYKDININNNKQFLNHYKIYLSILKFCNLFNLKNGDLKDLDESYKIMKKTYEE